MYLGMNPKALAQRSLIYLPFLTHLAQEIKCTLWQLIGRPFYLSLDNKHVQGDRE